jgi:type IV secretion system protein VirB4
MLDFVTDRLGYVGGELNSDEYFPYIDHIGPTVMLLADSSCLSVLRLPGAPFALVMNGQRNANKRRLTAFLNAIADENVEVHIHLVKHDATLPPATHAEPVAPYARMLLADYHASIADDLAVCDWFLTIRVKLRVPPFATIRDKIRTVGATLGLMSKTAVLDPSLEVQLADAVRLGLGTLAPFGPVVLGERVESATDGEDLRYSEIAEFLYLLRTCQFSPQPLADVYGFIGAGIAGVDVTAVPGKRMLRIDHAAGGSSASQTHAAVLGLLTYPKRLSQDRMDELLSVPGRFVLTVAVRFQTRAEAQDDLDLLRRRLLSGDNKATEDTDDLDTAISNVAGGRAESGISRWSLVVHGGTPPEVDRLVSAARNIVANAGAKVGLESKGMLNAFLAQLPGAPLSTWIRPARCNSRQIAVLATLAGHARGPAKPRWDRHLFRMLSPAGTAFNHDIAVGDVAHNVIVAPNGEGKSVFLGMCLAALDAVIRHPSRGQPGTQIVFDIDESNHNTVVMLGGRYSTVSVGYSGIAPLHLPDTPRVRHMLRDLIAGLVQTDDAPKPTKAERDGIRAGVDFVMGELTPDERELSIIRNFMGFEDEGAGDRLEPWCRGNELGWVFDGPVHDVDFNTRLVGIDLTAVKDDARIMPPLAIVLLWMASDVMDGRRVVVWAEEAPAYMPTPAFSRAFKGIALRGRKRNSSFNAIAQQPSDLLTNEAGHALVKQARQMILFRNDKANDAATSDAYRGGFGLTPAELRAIGEDMFAVPWRSVLVKRQDGQSGLNRFDLSSLPQHLNILSGTPSRVRLLRQCLEHSGGDEMQAFAAFQSRIHETAA